MITQEANVEEKEERRKGEGEKQNTFTHFAHDISFLEFTSAKFISVNKILLLLAPISTQRKSHSLFSFSRRLVHGRLVDVSSDHLQLGTCNGATIT